MTPSSILSLSIADAGGVQEDETERKAIRRVLASLTKQNQIVPKGSVRSRVYVVCEQERETGVPHETDGRSEGLTRTLKRHFCLSDSSQD